MRTMFFVAMVAALLTVGTASAIEWKAMAVNDYGIGYATSDDEYEAKDLAIAACEEETARTCSWEQATSVPVGWYLIAAECRGGDYDTVTAGSKWDWEPARNQAIKKAFARDCWIINRWRPFH